MKPNDFPDDCEVLCDVCRHFGERGWCRATSGNFSCRVTDSHCMITQSGRDKSCLSASDLMVCDFDGNAIGTTSNPSAETPLHCRLYQLDSRIGAVLHTHSISSSLLSRHSGPTLSISGYEMQKALAGRSTHDQQVRVRVFDNDQDMQALAERIQSAWAAGEFEVPGFLIAGHGLYAWGEDVAEARRHVEGFEFLFECRWQESLAGLT